MVFDNERPLKMCDSCINSHEGPGSSIHRSKRHNNIFPHDTVTARAISRLSQAIARMTANDTIETDASVLEDIHRKEFTPSSSLTQLSVQTEGLNDTSTFGLFTQRSFLSRARSPLPLLNTGSKRSYNYVVGYSRPLDTRFPFSSASTTSSRRLSNLTRFQQQQPIICDDAASSDTSMLSLTPPRSEPTIGSSADLSSCAEESHPCSFHFSFRQKSWRKRRKERHNSHSTSLVGDCRWNRWRNPNPAIDDDERAHRALKRIDILDIDDDSSEEGPIKKARVTEKVLEIPPSLHRQGRCKCGNHRLRRTASLSPKRSHHRFGEKYEGGAEASSSRNLRKPTKFRKSLLNSRQATPSADHSAHCDSVSHDNHFQEFSSTQPLNGISDEDADGDDECSDASPRKK
ncbi:unnamed protein product [Hymenolepis diminuta]|uniref:Uncharacterized protein n=1 Tax=Hymenolepis diminuta TaxID=6216 RepID=A0A564YH20_HYMDI|nr:unnamed protein product [Hymenolepis diminuta]